MLWAVIMAGGSGTRFWPESREKKPKQFLDLFGKRTLLEETVVRLRGVIPPSRVIVVTQQDKVSLVKKLLKIPTKHIIGEPIGRNTAPCAVLAAQVALKEDPNAIIALLPADHQIGKVALFKRLLKTAAQVADKKELPVTFGIKPSFPHTGYGYLEMGKRASRSNRFDVYHLKCFHEKPKFAKAKKFYKSGKFLWNSGMFVWKAQSLLEASQKYLPKAKQLGEKILKGGLSKKMKTLFPKMPNISIDYGLMEKLKGKILTIPVDLDWNDLGGWLSFESLWKKDSKGNVAKGESLFIESKGNLVKSDKRLIALLGVEDLVVVDTPDALLVCPKKETENVRKIVAELKKKKKRYL